MQNWKGRLRASGIHLGISLGIATLAAVLVFGLWYPYPYREISGGRSLFVLLVSVDVVMGPLITLTIFNRAKPRRELLMDLTVVGLLQLAALGYGLWTVFVARPVHLAFEYSRMSVVHAIDVDPDLLAKAPPALQKLPITGPTLIALRPFKDASEQFEATMSAIGGVPLSARSDLWQSYASSTADILKEAKPVTNLRTRFADQTALIDRAVEDTGKPASQLRYLPLVGRNKAWTMLLDASSAEPLGFLPLDPF
ncbi:TfpX/TfpZ family type IV pilin accessory protein [Verminephrobacter aporrectodeae]|uniref:TfpX/TfpZ family type IV pilin accessory protein n=1 Tax=Verminephrobacter aporrectodeae TaxID=1110389 RepID=UPI0022373218|nr:TfpX/TfpZ family type IV pilin accessory protein [Verminephrobacter aporrectodeae]MCW5256525.1 pilus assembly protein [Verminephrobacter aporrectodeae subsp. tuberculatae]MCW8176898.1 pilus assembly protein [Verminephrobacter aporrectodeae subsp. tuberculatae]MCW8204676.1 pilus assembly protein [Verminephrobacter aporrectodeae subsp. tuberculatae]